ncbi:MAG: universal stress protein [Deltaproteobacteria bacterium]|nr:universal stress protein [Deltaproteobacteria bacterium]
MKIIVPTIGSLPGQRTVGYVINIAKRLHAQLVVLHVLTENETEAAGEQSLSLFIENGKEEKVPVNGILRRGDIVPVIIEVAEEKSVDLIVLGASHGEIVAEWMNAKSMEKTAIPVLLIPKWVPAADRSSPNG